MTEAEWLACDRPRELFPPLEQLATQRKARLYACACVRLLWNHLVDERSRRAVAVAEDFADGSATPAELASAHRAARDAYHDLSRKQSPDSSFALAAAETARPTFRVGERVDLSLTLGPVVAVYAADLRGNLPVDLLRDLFGNPFRPVIIEDAWRTAAVVQLAREMYEQRDFTRMPRLAEALKQAGCASAEVLSHCRQRGPHARGCWLLDGLLQ
jgi:hypothetical protein